MKTEAALGFGGNLGDPVDGLRGCAAAPWRGNPAIVLLRQSSVYRTAPWGKLDQPDFLNMAVLIETALPPRDLLALCLEIERERGRERIERWGPRTLDIDILTYGDAVDRRARPAGAAPAHRRARLRADAAGGDRAGSRDRRPECIRAARRSRER